MASPFPGMDPYLESPTFWGDFHSTFINYWREALAEELPEDYEANLGERVYLVEHDPDARKLIYPDVALTEGETPLSPGPGGSGGVATLEPVNIPLTILEGPRETYIEILHRPDRSLVGVLELLSPANKEQPGRTEYLAKRNALLYQQVHLVELDLLMGGRRLPLQKPLPAADYYYLLSRAEERPNCQVYSWTVRDPLPRLPVPLKAGDGDVPIDYGVVFRTAYERGRFGRRLAYGGPCPAALGEEGRRWAEGVIQRTKEDGQRAKG